jgi:kynureninase
MARAGARGFEVVEIDANGPEHADASTYLEAIDQRTSIVALSLVSPRSGALLDVRAVAARARDADAILVIDACEAVGVVPIRVHELAGDVALVGGTHKWLGGGGTGVAFGYVAPSLCDRLEPAYPGWIGAASMLAFADRFVPHRGARKLEQGTPALEPIYTSRAGLSFVRDAGIDALRARSLVLTECLIARADGHGLEVRTPRDLARRGGMICLAVPRASEIVDALERQRIDIDERPGAGIRIGPHPCVTEEECVHAIDAIAAERDDHAA